MPQTSEYLQRLVREVWLVFSRCHPAGGIADGGFRKGGIVVREIQPVQSGQIARIRDSPGLPECLFREHVVLKGRHGVVAECQVETLPNEGRTCNRR